jgi:2-polyprenyl-6-methoxyphenol hydroxylase-like FAD-dependent oxidoreductase
MIQQILTGKLDNGGHCVWSTSLGSPRTHGVVLVGNSRHGMWPSLQQGAKYAMESPAVLIQAVQDHYQ